LSSGSVTGWGGWHARRRTSQLWSQLSALVGCRCTCSFVSPACLRILCGDIFAMKAAGRLVLTKHCWVSLYRSLNLLMPRKLNTPLLCFLELGIWFVNETFCVHYCHMRKDFFAHFGHGQYQVHVRLFQLYPTSLSCHSSRHIENL
jgi:hypothetical protein